MTLRICCGFSSQKQTNGDARNAGVEEQECKMGDRMKYVESNTTKKNGTRTHD